MRFVFSRQSKMSCSIFGIHSDQVLIGRNRRRMISRGLQRFCQLAVGKVVFGLQGQGDSKDFGRRLQFALPPQLPGENDHQPVNVRRILSVLRLLAEYVKARRGMALEDKVAGGFILERNVIHLLPRLIGELSKGSRFSKYQDPLRRVGAAGIIKEQGVAHRGKLVVRPSDGRKPQFEGVGLGRGTERFASAEDFGGGNVPLFIHQ